MKNTRHSEVLSVRCVSMNKIITKLCHWRLQVLRLCFSSHVGVADETRGLHSRQNRQIALLKKTLMHLTAAVVSHLWSNKKI